MPETTSTIEANPHTSAEITYAPHVIDRTTKIKILDKLLESLFPGKSFYIISGVLSMPVSMNKVKIGRDNIFENKAIIPRIIITVPANLQFNMFCAAIKNSVWQQCNTPEERRNLNGMSIKQTATSARFTVYGKCIEVRLEKDSL